MTKKTKAAVPSNFVYVIQCINYEYDDNYYHQTEGGNPNSYYKAEAMEKCAELNAKERADCDPRDYSSYEELAVEDIDFYTVVSVPLGS